MINQQGAMQCFKHSHSAAVSCSTWYLPYRVFRQYPIASPMQELDFRKKVATFLRQPQALSNHMLWAQKTSKGPEYQSPSTLSWQSTAVVVEPEGLCGVGFTTHHLEAIGRPGIPIQHRISRNEHDINCAEEPFHQRTNGDNAHRA